MVIIVIKEKNKGLKTKKIFKILYKTKTIISINEFKKFQKFYLNKFNSSFFPKLIMVILAVVAVALNLLKGNLDIVFIVIVFIIIYPFLLKFALNRQINKMYKSNKKINMLEENINFYEDFFESKSKINYSKTFYDDIYLVCYVKVNIYIFIIDNQGFILI